MDTLNWENKKEVS